MTSADILYDRLDELFDALRGSDVHELEVIDMHGRVRVHRRAGLAPTGAEAGTATDELDGPIEEPTASITSSLVGTFYRAARLGEPAFVDVGSQVREDTIVGIIEALQVLTEVEAGCTGRVVEALANDGQPVEYGQVLFRVTADG